MTVSGHQKHVYITPRTYQKDNKIHSYFKHNEDSAGVNSEYIEEAKATYFQNQVLKPDGPD